MSHCGVLGIDSRSCPLALRERVTADLEKHFSKTLIEASFPYVLLSTCQRAELYFCCSSPAVKAFEIISFFQNRYQELSTKHFYTFYDENVWTHLAKVTAGIESTIVGETEIQGQVKRAYLLYKETGCLNAELHQLFQKSLGVAKQHRFLHQSSLKGVSLESVIFSKIRDQLHQDKPLEVLFIGYSKMNQGLMRSFERKGFSSLSLVTTMPKELIEESFSSVNVYRREELSRIYRFDVVISATKDLKVILGKESFSRKKTLFFDLSIPRTIDPQSVGVSSCLFNIEELAQLCHKEFSLKSYQDFQNSERLEKNALAAFQRFVKKHDKERRALFLCHNALV